MSETEIITFDSPAEQSSYIKVIGVGGGGNNAVNHMYRKGIKGVDFIVCNTDLKALGSSPVPDKLQLSNTGLGVGGRPAKARKAAEERETEIQEIFQQNTKMVFITAGMGGGTGTGAAPVIARMAKEIKLEAEDPDDPEQILVVAVVTTPFLYEGYRRVQQAQEGVNELRKYVDSILVINNEKLRSYGNLVMTDAFAMANDVLLTAVKGIAEIITLNAYVNIDFCDVYTVMEHSGTALMGIGEGEGENRARQAVEEATTSVLLNDNDIYGAKHVLLNFSYGPEHEITMDEMGIVADYITSKTGSMETNVIWGMGPDDSLGDKVKITLIATGFEQRESNEGATFLLEEAPEKPHTDMKAIKEPTLVHHEPTNDPEPRDNYVPPAIETVASPVNDWSRPRQTEQPHKNIIPLYDDVDEKKTTRKDAVNNEDDGLRLVTHTSDQSPVAKPADPWQNNPIRANEPVIESPRPAAPSPTQREVSAPAGNRNQFAAMNDRKTTPNPHLDMMAMDRAERIKAINNLLRNDANGAQIVESMSIAEIAGMAMDDLMQKTEGNPHSAASEATASSVAADGTMRSGVSIFNLPD